MRARYLMLQGQMDLAMTYLDRVSNNNNNNNKQLRCQISFEVTSFLPKSVGTIQGYSSFSPGA